MGGRRPRRREEDQARGDVGEHHQAQHRPERRTGRAGDHRTQVDRTDLFEDLEAHRRDQPGPGTAAPRHPLAGQPRDDPGEQQPRHSQRHHLRDDRQERRQRRRVVNPDPAQHLFHQRHVAQRREHQGQQDRDERRHQHHRVGEFGPHKSRRLAAVGAPHLAQGLAQVVHPPQSGPQCGGEADDADGGARRDRRIHQLHDLLSQVAVDDRFDPVLDPFEQLGPPGQDETTGGEADHQDREHREDGEVRDAGGVEVALAVVVALLGPQDVVEPRHSGPHPVEEAGLGRVGHPVSTNRVRTVAVGTLSAHIPGSASLQTPPGRAARQPPAPPRARPGHRPTRRPGP